MKTTVYYFSGTGNSLAIARELHDRLEGSNIDPIAKHSDEGAVSTDADALVIVCPLYFFGLPALVADFVQRLKPERKSRIYAVITRGSSPGWALMQMRRILAEKGLDFSGGFYVTMGTNYIPRYRMSTDERVLRLFHRAQRRIEKIAVFLKEGRRKKSHDIPLFRSLTRIAYRRWMRGIHEKDRYFLADEKCTSCGICVRICPVKNIQLAHGKPCWGGNCQQCFACLHFCPVSAIQYGNRTVNKRRYHHPSITVEDMMIQRKFD